MAVGGGVLLHEASHLGIFLDVCVRTSFKVKRQKIFSPPERPSACLEESCYIADSFMSVRLTSAWYRVIARAGREDLEKQKAIQAMYV